MESDELGYLAGEISKQGVTEGVARLLLAVYSKMREEGDKLQRGLENKKNKHLMIWKILNLSIWPKMPRCALEKGLRVRLDKLWWRD